MRAGGGFEIVKKGYARKCRTACPHCPWVLAASLGATCTVARGRYRGTELADRKLTIWVYLDANWSFYGQCSPAEKERDEGLRLQSASVSPAFSVSIANESDQVT